MESATAEAKPKPAAPATSPVKDNRFKMLDAKMKRHHHSPDALIEVLHTAQELFGCLDNELLMYVAHGLRQPPSRVFGVATFYHFFSLAPKGEHKCVVCMGTACYVKGADELLAGVEKRAGIKAGETTPDGKLSVLTARCIGACGIAPAVVFDGTVVGKLTLESTLNKIEGWLEDGSN